MNRPLSPRELVAFETMIRDDLPAAQALCFPAYSSLADRNRALEQIAAARERDEEMRRPATATYSPGCLTRRQAQ